MGHFVRVFCTKGEIPPLTEVFSYTSSNGVRLSVAPTDSAVDILSPNWSEVEVSYNPAKNALVIECNHNDGSENCLARAEVEEFIDEIGSPGLSLIKRRILRHLRATKFIISSQLLQDIDDSGYRANSVFLEYFVSRCGGLFHADGEGFYDGDKPILRVM